MKKDEKMAGSDSKGGIRRDQGTHGLDEQAGLV